MPTGQELITDALTILALNDPGGIPSVSDSTASLRELNNMWESFGIDEGLIYAEDKLRFVLETNLGVYTVGQLNPFPGVGQSAVPYCQGARPARIYRADIITLTGGAITGSALGDIGAGYAVNDTGIILGTSGTPAAYTVNTVNAAGSILTITISSSGTGYQLGNGFKTQNAGAQPGIGAGLTFNVTNATNGGQQRTMLKIVNADTYYGHRDLSATTFTPDELYPDYLPDVDGFTRLYFYPIPSNTSPPAVEIVTAVGIALWTLGGNQFVPQGYRDLIENALAYRLLSFFGIQDQAIIDNITAKGLKAESRMREMNKRNRQLMAGSELPPAVQEQAEAGAK